MKLNGKKVQGLNQVIVPIVRAGGGDLIFIFEAVNDDTEFDELLPRPRAPMVLMKGETVAVPDLKDEEYLKAKNDWAKKYNLWHFLKSMAATPTLVWETVDMKVPSSWANYTKELTDSGLSNVEVNQLWDGYQEANSLNEEKIKAARDRFLQSRAKHLA